MKKFFSIVMCALAVVSCGTLTNTAGGALIGGGSGAAIGAAAGALIGKDGKSAAIGTAIGTIVGAGVGTIIGQKMDKKAEELAALEGAQVDIVEDANGLNAIKVTFDSGILFATNSSALSTASKAALKDFAVKMADMPETDITIYGHTDNTGSDAVNEKLSNQRANSVATYLQNCGIAKTRITSEGKSYSMPVASNETAEGRAQNRRVEVYISANQNMIQQAQNGTL